MANHLLTLINDCRSEMIELAKKYGFASDQTLKCSQQLDTLLNRLMIEEQNKRTDVVS